MRDFVVPFIFVIVIVAVTAFIPSRNECPQRITIANMPVAGCNR